MITKITIGIKGKHKKPILIDISYLPSASVKPIIIFCHGYKGFKDWGAWNLMASTFAEAGFYFVKFNFSHNGCTPEQPLDFPDLEAFGNNNYTIELDDLEAVINWIMENRDLTNVADIKNVTLVGHSRGGGIVCIKAEEDSRIKKVISLAGVCDFSSRTASIGDLKSWKKDGVKYVLNGRTKQQMPHYYQFYEDFFMNEERLTIKRAVSNLQIPYLIIHGNEDTSISIEEAKNLHKWNPNSKLEIIQGANHVFGCIHPWKKNDLPQDLKNVMDVIISFLDQC